MTPSTTRRAGNLPGCAPHMPGNEATVTYNAKADQWAADCERMGRDQMRADLALAEQESVFNRSRWFDAFLAVFGIACGLALVMA